jgi:purine-cytosine permease-like protein
VLGGFWPTWALALTVAAAGPLSYAPSLGDYTRRISRKHGDKPVLLAATAGVFGGLFLTTLFGAFTALCLTNLGDSYVADLVAAAPLWYVLPLLVIGLAGGVGQGVLNLYASGLDLAAIVPRVRRVHTTLLTSVAAIALVFAGTFAFSAVDSITAMTLVLNGVAVPWVIVNVLGFLVARRREYDPHAVQAWGDRNGRYWFTGGFILRAVAAWAAGSAFGLLAVTTELYTGPLANLAGGVDISLAGSALVAAAVYLTALAVFPEGGNPK